MTGPTIMVTRAVAETSTPSLATYVKVTTPLKFRGGVYTKEPSPASARFPTAGGMSSTALNVWGGMSPSLSLPSTPGAVTVRTVSSVAVYISAAVIGAALTSATVMVMVSASSSAPSLTRTVAV